MKKGGSIEIIKVANGFIASSTEKPWEDNWGTEVLVFHTITELNEWLECDHYADEPMLDKDAIKEYWRNRDETSEAEAAKAIVKAATKRKHDNK